jgi:dimethylargininase
MSDPTRVPKDGRSPLAGRGEFLAKEDFKRFNILRLDDQESDAANGLWVNDRVFMPTGYPRARQTIESAGDSILEVDVSEFRKLDGGLSYLSLRFGEGNRL